MFRNLDLLNYIKKFRKLIAFMYYFLILYYFLLLRISTGVINYKHNTGDKSLILNLANLMQFKF
jgi:hypothetical protein